MDTDADMDVVTGTGTDPGQGLTCAALAKAYLWACRLELAALKPGNVHIYADGHNMKVKDFLRSARITAPIVTDMSLSVGARIRQGVEHTLRDVGCNTNLGILLLAVPLLEAARDAGKDGNMRHSVGGVLANLTPRDAADVHAAIAHANPGGLGRVARYDVRDGDHVSSVSLAQTMAAAAGRDTIARQYSLGFRDIFSPGVAVYYRALARYGSPAWAASCVYIAFLSARLDGHVLRKNGARAARDLRIWARREKKRLAAGSDPRCRCASWQHFDRELKHWGVNPGSTADLTVAVLLTARIRDMLADVSAHRAQITRG